MFFDFHLNPPLTFQRNNKQVKESNKQYHGQKEKRRIKNTIQYTKPNAESIYSDTISDKKNYGWFQSILNG